MAICSLWDDLMQGTREEIWLEISLDKELIREDQEKIKGYFENIPPNLNGQLLSVHICISFSVAHNISSAVFLAPRTHVVYCLLSWHKLLEIYRGVIFFLDSSQNLRPENC